MKDVIKNHHTSCRAYSLDLFLVKESDWMVVLVCDRGGKNITKQFRHYETKEQAVEYYDKILHVCNVQGFTITDCKQKCEE